MSGIHCWESTRIWEKLKDKTDVAKEARKTLEQIMPRIQGVLAYGGTSSTDFTLHDSGHAFRVAERMFDIIPQDVLTGLSAYELAFLLLSAYLHDIGMTPRKGKVRQHYEYLMTGEKGDLSQSEIDSLQEWLDDQGYDIVPPLPQETPTVKEITLAEEIMTYYCRYCHNGWSEEWIRNNLGNRRLGTYGNWIDDLVSLCKSHHEGYDELAKDRFEPRILGEGTSPIVVHLRYLAAALRLADILELDPERTPEVVFRHRDISPKSAIYWWKDHYISLVKEENRLVLWARPPNAYIHRAIEVTADEIDEELRMCRILADETHFEKCPGLSKDLPHRWDLPSSVHRSIVPKDNAYEYIDGSFRPNTHKILELLSGVQLYGNPLTAVRELVQNSFDAVREKIAYQRLMQDNPDDKELEHNLGSLCSVELIVEQRDDSLWLVCKDVGVGMTKRIIRDHLLVSGSARRHDILALERRCREKGFELGRSGQFGIGVLSYFMIADKIIIKTQRDQCTGDYEPNGWRLETEGIGSFGELKKDVSLAHGTEVHLRLKTEVVKTGLQGWFRELRHYLEENLFYVPCRFRLRSELPECDELIVNPGWVSDTGRFTDKLFEGLSLLNYKDIELYSQTRRQELENQTRYFQGMRQTMEGCLQWKVEEGMVPDNMGRYRIHLPYYELPGGISLAFLNLAKSEDELVLEEIMGTSNVSPVYGFIGEGELAIGWKGMRVEEDPRYIGARISRRSIFVEIDWHSPSAGKVSVDRNGFEISGTAKTVVSWLNGRISSAMQELIMANSDSAYHLPNFCIAEAGFPSTKPLYWVNTKKGKAMWKSLTFPATCVPSDRYWPELDIRWKGRTVSAIQAMSLVIQTSYHMVFGFPYTEMPPDRVMACPEESAPILPLWTEEPGSVKKEKPFGPMALFPPEWRDLCNLATLSKDFDFEMWNLSHPLVHLADEAGWKWLSDVFPPYKHPDPLPFEKEILDNRSIAASWILLMVKRYQSPTSNIGSQEIKDLWDGVKERAPSFLKRLWQLVFEDENRLEIPICFLRTFFGSRLLDVLTYEGWSIYTESSDIEKYLPEPGPEWRLEVRR